MSTNLTTFVCTVQLSPDPEHHLDEQSHKYHDEIDYVCAGLIMLCEQDAVKLILFGEMEQRRSALWPCGKALAQRLGDAWFDPRPSQTKDFKIGISS
ncbi:hypothetical protein ElyMa_005567400 [Elysia marginata]|uniref:Uncharacterized protein n=1 Tax=Elysia marginata TaxID=1093978 RepID=A0AAV4F1D6_9GAST|nr:hypothetical protein ElyMa_005567400 [Elysia marginata]